MIFNAPFKNSLWHIAWKLCRRFENKLAKEVVSFFFCFVFLYNLGIIFKTMCAKSEKKFVWGREGPPTNDFFTITFFSCGPFPGKMFWFSGHMI